MTPAAFLPAAADSARAIERMYTVSLSALVPIGVAAVAAVALRGSQAASRAAVWRATVAALLLVYFGGLFPVHRLAVVVPDGLASPLILLGRMQVGAPSPSITSNSESVIVHLAFLIYLVGASVVLIPLALAALGLSRRTARATPANDPRLLRIFDDAKGAVGVRRSVRLLISPDTLVPLTCGALRPAVLLPADVMRYRDDRLRSLLLHELSHVQAHDAAFTIASRIACALLWFHPAAWWVDRRLRADCEIACDDRVLAAGVRQSDYAELLVEACDRLHGDRSPPLTLAICGHAGLRQRLGLILGPARQRRRTSRFAGAMAMTFTLVVAVPASLTQLAPARSVLTALMRDPRWQSRAYAVLGLAQRADSIEVARSAAATDPDPKVRAWARYALSLEPIDARAHLAPSAR
jgi:beta-lactamase regulating signal transducer with metallopeptidase domain